MRGLKLAGIVIGTTAVCSVVAIITLNQREEGRRGAVGDAVCAQVSWPWPEVAAAGITDRLVSFAIGDGRFGPESRTASGPFRVKALLLLDAEPGDRVHAWAEGPGSLMSTHGEQEMDLRVGSGFDLGEPRYGGPPPPIDVPGYLTASVAGEYRIWVEINGKGPFGPFCVRFADSE